MKGFAFTAIVVAVYLQQSSKFGNAGLVRTRDFPEFYDALFGLSDDEKCVDANPSECPSRFDFDFCQKNYYTMLNKCRKTCHLCEVVKPPSPTDCEDIHPDCADMIKKHHMYCDYTPIARNKECRKSCGTCSEGTKTPPLPVGPIEAGCEDRLPNCGALIAADDNYCRIANEVKDDLCQKSCGNCGEKQPQQPFPTGSTKGCKDEHPDCAEMISKHHMYCKYTPIARNKECRKSCGTCAGDSKMPHPTGPTECRDEHPDCVDMVSKHHMYCSYTKIAREKECRKSCGTCSDGEKRPSPLPTDAPKEEKRPLPLPTGKPEGEKRPLPLPTGLPIEP